MHWQVNMLFCNSVVTPLATIGIIFENKFQYIEKRFHSHGCATKSCLSRCWFWHPFLPATKTMPKELLPIVDKPLIQYAAEEAIAAGIDTLIFVTGRNKRAIEDHFDANNELETMLRAKGKDAQADMVRNIIPEGVECIFVRQAEQLGLGHAVLCAERAVGGDPFAVLLADDFLTDYEPGVTADLAQAYALNGKSQLLVMEVDGPDISKYGVVVPNGPGAGIAGLVEKPDADDAPSNLASIGRYVLNPDIFLHFSGSKGGIWRGNTIGRCD